jgi:hypothetical protein
MKEKEIFKHIFMIQLPPEIWSMILAYKKYRLLHILQKYVSEYEMMHYYYCFECDHEMLHNDRMLRHPEQGIWDAIDEVYRYTKDQELLIREDLHYAFYDDRGDFKGWYKARIPQQPFLDYEWYVGDKECYEEENYPKLYYSYEEANRRYQQTEGQENSTQKEFKREWGVRKEDFTDREKTRVIEYFLANFVRPNTDYLKFPKWTQEWVYIPGEGYCRKLNLVHSSEVGYYDRLIEDFDSLYDPVT